MTALQYIVIPGFERGQLLGGRCIISIFLRFTGITAHDIGASHDKCNKNSNCPLLFAEDIAFDTTEQRRGHGTSVSIFPDSISNIRLFRVSHANFTNPYETEIIGVNLQCSLGLMDVFLQDTCVGSAAYHQWSYKECVRGGTDAHANGTMRCTYRCYPINNSNTTFVRFARVNYNTADNNVWALKAILTHDIN